MSIICKTLDDTLSPQFDLSLLSISTKEILKYMIILLGAEIWTDDAVRQELDSFTRRFVHAAELNGIIAWSHVCSAQAALSCALMEWESHRQCTTAYELQSTCNSILIARANIADSWVAYKEAIRGFQSIFEVIANERGPDTPVRIESKAKYAYQMNIEHVTIGKIGESIIRYAEEALKLSQDVDTWLSEFYTILQTFLQDETASLDIPLSSVPFITPGWNARLQLLTEQFDNGKHELNIVQKRNRTWFNIHDENWLEYILKDNETREASVQPPPLKVKYAKDLPDEPEILRPIGAFRTKELFQQTFTNTSRTSCVMTLEKKYQFQPRPLNSSLVLVFSLNPTSLKARYSKVIIRCRIQPVNLPAGPSNKHSIRTIDHHPKVSEDVDIHWEPGYWEPDLKTSQSPSDVEWTFYQKWSCLNSSAPFAIPLSLDIDHDVPISLDVHVRIVRRRYILGTQVDECVGQCNILVSESTP